MNFKIKFIASYMYYKGTKETEYGTMTFYIDDFSKEINVSEKYLIKHYEEIVSELLTHPGVIDVYGSEIQKYFDITFSLNYCGIEAEEE